MCQSLIFQNIHKLNDICVQISLISLMETFFWILAVFRLATVILIHKIQFSSRLSCISTVKFYFCYLKKKSGVCNKKCKRIHDVTRRDSCFQKGNRISIFIILWEKNVMILCKQTMVNLMMIKSHFGKFNSRIKISS